MNSILNPIVIGKYIDYYTPLVRREFNLPNLTGVSMLSTFEWMVKFKLDTSKYEMAIL